MKNYPKVVKLKDTGEWGQFYEVFRYDTANLPELITFLRGTGCWLRLPDGRDPHGYRFFNEGTFITAIYNGEFFCRSTIDNTIKRYYIDEFIEKFEEVE